MGSEVASGLSTGYLTVVQKHFGPHFMSLESQIVRALENFLQLTQNDIWKISGRP